VWACFIPMHLIGLYALYTIFAGTAPQYWYLYAIAGYILIKMFGISACYHRLVSHRAFKVNRFWKLFILACAILSAQNSPIIWALIHRGYHHRYSDTDRDPHSPQVGFWHSYILWIFKTDASKMTTKYIPDVLRDADYLFAHNWYTVIFWILNGLAMMVGFDFWLYCIMFGSFLGYHAFALNTSVNHYKHLGYRNYETKDDSSNIVWLWFFILGEAWHNNHHGVASDPNFGGKRWWELDPTYWLICAIRKKDDGMEK